MGEERAVELRHDGKIYRAPNRKVFFRWAREHRISGDDSYRVAGSGKWIPVTAHKELRALLNPENWWKVKMGGKTYVAPDWDTIVVWAHEGRLSSDVQVEGPKTPPGGILGKASPELSPYLRNRMYDEQGKKPVKVRFDGKVYVPGDMETIRKWIKESRIPMEAQVLIDGDNWQPILESGYFSRDIWPVNDPGETLRKDGPPVPSAASPGIDAPAAAVKTPDRKYVEGNNIEEKDGFYRISTSYGNDFVLDDPGEIRRLLKNRRINGFDEVRHPDLPGGRMFVSEFVKEYLPRGSGIVTGILTGVFAAAAAAGIFLFFEEGEQWMLIGGGTSLVMAVVFAVRLIWKR